MLEPLKRELRGLIANNRIESVLARLLDEMLATDSPLYDQAVHLRAAYIKWEEEVDIIRIRSRREGGIEANEITNGLLKLVSRLQVTDLRKSSQQAFEDFRTIPPYHALGVDRVPQRDQFNEKLIFGAKEQRVHFYYCYGDFNQAVDALVERLNYEHNGYQFSTDHLESGQKRPQVNIRICQLETRGSERMVYFYLLRAVATHFLGPINDQRALLEKNLADLLSSPSLRDLGPDDAVFIQISINEDNWRRKEVTAALRQFYQKFCGEELPAPAPKFYFFFGVEYRRDNLRIKQDVAEAISQRTYGEALEELLAVERADLVTWLQAHPQLIASGQTAASLADKLYGAAEKLDMVKLRKTLEETIDKYNEGHFS